MPGAAGFTSPWTLGPMFLGNVANWLFYGTMIIQIYIYLTRYQSLDRPIVKYLDYVVLVETVQSVTMTHATWWILVENWGKPQNLPAGTWSAALKLITDCPISVSVQWFFAWRIWKLNPGTKFIKGLILAIIPIGLTNIALAITVTTLWFTKYDGMLTTMYKPEIRRYSTAFMALEALADVLVAGCMIFTLRRYSLESNVSRTQNVLKRIAIRAFESSAITSAVVITSLGLNLAASSQGSSFNLLFTQIVSKLYANVLMYNLNSREQHKGTIHTGITTVTAGAPLSTFDARSGAPSYPSTNRTQRPNDLELGSFNDKVSTLDPGVHVRREIQVAGQLSRTSIDMKDEGWKN